TLDTQIRTQIAQAHTAPVLTESDWLRIVRARRTHVHSRVAIARLANLLVGEVPASTVPAPDSGVSSTTLTTPASAEGGGSIRRFDAWEYRRYALTEKTLVVPGGGGNAIYRLRFCLLYPYEPREGAPEGFEPGQCVEIQVRVGGVV
ncbi:hypothetical protein HK104_007796, partial [Borealophlyctis nickersoniae]